MSAETKTLHDHIDIFDLSFASAQSMACVLEDLILEGSNATTLNQNDPQHPTQKMHACLVAIRCQLAAIESTVHGMGGANG
jgi:hypothetical protein